MAVTKKRRRKSTKKLNHGAAYIQASKSNTIITITDDGGNTVSWSSSGAVGFKGSKQKTPFAAQQAAELAGKTAREMGLKSVDVYVKGPGNGRESAIRALQTADLDITMIKDISPIPHNGCRPPKRRRI
jgi:small subunit ribosomal protein S11